MPELLCTMIKDFTPRLYQETILNSCVKKNTLVVLPTGMGKTAIALMLAVQRLSQFPQSKIVFLAPTKPLCDQHYQTFTKHLSLPQEKMAVFTGETPPDERAALWEHVQCIFSTPQGLENDVLGSKISLKNASLLVLDEAHRAVGEYAYCWIAKQYQKMADFPRILALTASPGSDMEKITEVCKNLSIEEVEVRSDDDPDVAAYKKEVITEWKKITLPPQFLDIKRQLETCIKNKIQDIKQLGLITSTQYVTKKEILGLTASLQKQITSGDRGFDVLRALSLSAEVMKAQHALELLESQGIRALQTYFEKMFAEALTGKTKAAKNLVEDIYFKAASIKTKTLFDAHIEHPKLEETCSIVRQEYEKNQFMKIIIFTQYRDTTVMIAEALKKIPHIIPAIFVGQAKKGTTGLSQKKQIETIAQFRDGLYNVLIATSVAEEGLDIPCVDVVLFYEPIASAIRHIQRRGRTGRQEEGRVIILVAKETHDEAYLYAARRKEQTMKHILSGIKKTLQPIDIIQTTIHKEEKLRVIVDYREKNSPIVKLLAENNTQLTLGMLESADYVLSKRVGIEYKTVPDFVASIIDGRLLSQLKDLKRNFERPVVLIEGTEDMYAVRNIHPNAITGMLATISVSYGIPVLRSKDARESVALLLAIAKREQEETTSTFSYHADRKPITLKEQQEYLVSCLPSVGPQLAKTLLAHFKNVKTILNASEEELKQVPGVGEKIARGIKELSEREYK